MACGGCPTSTERLFSSSRLCRSSSSAEISAARLFPSAGTVEVLGERLGRVDISELHPRIGLCSSALARTAMGGGSALPLRIGAAALWIFAIVLEVLALCAMTEKIVIPFLVKLSPLVQGIVLLVIDFIAVVASAQIGRCANSTNSGPRRYRRLIKL